jgi:hypothetical protein
MGDAIARLKKLRSCFQRAKKRLEALPECGLSEAGQPYIQEVADALQSFASWFGELTFDHYSGFGSACRVHAALAAFDAIVDWVGLHRSQQFASDISGQMAELVEQSQALDDAVMAAFLVEKTPSKVVYCTSASVPQSKRDAVEDGIEAVASLARHLGVRLQRIAMMVNSQPTPIVSKPGGTKPRKRRGGKGPGGRPQEYPLKFIKEVFTAREKEERLASAARRRLPKKSTWLFDYCNVHGINHDEMFPKADKKTGERLHWDQRSNRFWKAGAKRLREPGN